MTQPGPAPGPGSEPEVEDPAGQGSAAAAAPPRVRVLEDRLINQIAAGEVVERPASVLKELVENSLDAGSKHLRVSLRGGGRDLIEIEDNGAGMGRQDAMLCVERHATSKLRRDEDLFAIRTLGFRGEALPSIAAVSRFELTTRRSADRVGTRVVIDAGRMVDVRDAGCPAGTRIVVRSLFYNLPARRKFLRTQQTELGHCRDALLRQVLARGEVGVELFSDGRPLLRTSATTEPVARAQALLGRSAQRLLPVSFHDDSLAGGLRVQGLVSPPDAHQASARGSLWLTVNGRPVRDPLLRRAVLDAFRGLVPRGRYPTAILDVAVAIDRVDVNVHPAKTEVRFRDSRDVLRAVADGLRRVLADQGLSAHRLRSPRGQVVPSAMPSKLQERLPGLPGLPALPALHPQPEGSGPDLVAESSDLPSAQSRHGRPQMPQIQPTSQPQPQTQPRPRTQPQPQTQTQTRTQTQTQPRSQNRTQPRSQFQPQGPALSTTTAAAPSPSLRLLGQLDERWLVCEQGGDLILVDQLRARTAALARQIAADSRPLPLLTPVLVELDAPARKSIERSQSALLSLGVELEAFGGETVSLRALPAALAGVAPATVVTALVAALEGRPGTARGAGSSSGLDSESELDRLRHALAACAAQPDGQRLSPYEQRGLVAELNPDQPGVCLRLPADDLSRQLSTQSRL